MTIMTSKHIIASALILLALASCEKNVTIDIPKKNPKLVINSVMQKGIPLTASIGKSRHILEAPGLNPQDTYIVTDALTVLFENGTPVDTLVYDAGYHLYRTSHNTALRNGYNYTLRVGAPGFTQAEALTIVPSQAAIAELTVVRNARIDAYGDHQDEIRIKFNDPAEKNFYQIQVLSSYYGTSGYPISCVQTTDKDVEAVGYNDPIGGDDCLDGGSILLRDDNFNGGQKTVSLFVSSSSLMEYTDGAGNIHRPFIRLNGITEDHFRFIKTHALYDNAGDNPFAEPVNVYTNVKNGYGIFAGFTSAVDTLR